MDQPPRRPEQWAAQQNDQTFTGQRPSDTRGSAGDGPIASGIRDARETLDQGVNSIGSVVGDLIGDMQEIIRGEVKLAKTELKEEASTMGAGAGMLAGAAAFGLVGLIFLMLTVMFLLHTMMRMWFAAGLVTIGILLIAAILAIVGKSKIQQANLVPEKTIDSLKEDQQWAKRQMNSVKN